jgi:hypothetical protein
MKKDTEALEVKIISLIVKNVETTYTESIWVEDENHPNFGSIQNITKMHKDPVIDIQFRASVNRDLKIGSIYTDGINNYVATSKNEIVLKNKVKMFKIPTELTCILKTLC